MSRIRDMLALGGAVLLGAALVGCTDDGGDTIVQTQGAPSGITVTGTGRVAGAPDIASIYLGVQVQSATVEEGRERAAQIQTAVINSIKDNGVADRDVQTSNFSIQPNYDFRSGTQQITGYMVTNTLTIKVRKLDQLSKTIDDASKAGGDSAVVQNLTFGIDDPEELRSQARELALIQAKARAEDIARVTGVSLGKPISIVEETQSGIAYDSFLGQRATVSADTPTPIETGELDVVINVSVLYRIE